MFVLLAAALFHADAGAQGAVMFLGFLLRFLVHTPSELFRAVLMDTTAAAELPDDRTTGKSNLSAYGTYRLTYALGCPAFEQNRLVARFFGQCDFRFAV